MKAVPANRRIEADRRQRRFATPGSVRSCGTLAPT